MKILGSRELPCRHGRIHVTERDHHIITEFGQSVRVCPNRNCRRAYRFRLVPATEAQRITGDDVVRIRWEEEK